MRISRSSSSGCSPIDGSSQTYSTPISEEPICVARRIRCASPPEKRACSAIEGSGSPDRTSTRKAEPFPDLLQDLGGDGLFRAERAGESSPLSRCDHSRAVATERRVTSTIERPSTWTARDSGFKRAPPQPLQSTAVM